MLELEILGQESIDEETNEFVYGFSKKIRLEHSLLSLSKWEEKYEKPFLNQERLEASEMLDYIRFMTLDENVEEETYYYIDETAVEKIKAYFNRENTASWIKEDPNFHGRRAKETVTSELIYYWMVSYQIPFEAEKWNLKRLLMLIQICHEKSKDQKKGKRGGKSMMSQRRALNEARLAQKGGQ